MDDLKRRSKALGLRDSVQFIGYLDRKQELPDCYAAADVFVFASRTETQGLVLLEAMAAGLPVIALSEMGTTDILSPGRGAISPAGRGQGFWRNAGQFSQSAQRLAPSAPAKPRCTRRNGRMWRWRHAGWPASMRTGGLKIARKGR
jgi:1,2-diacylglycerol 3-alpha-glucosyltransferase